MFYDASRHTVNPKKQEAHDAISRIRIAITSQYASFRRDANSFFFIYFFLTQSTLSTIYRMLSAASISLLSL